jgi:IS5 family transposase
MERQLSFAQSEYVRKKKTTRRDKFLAEMEAVVPWARLVALIAPHYPKGRRGRPPLGVERMLRVYFLQQWYGLADEALEDTIYDSQAMRGFVGVDLGAEGAPDATTLLHFRHLLEQHELTRSLLAEVNALLTERGLLLRTGTLVDATIIAAPSSTKNRERRRDPEMHQAKKGNQWHFGMKAHLGADADSGLVHRVVGTAAHVSDLSQTHALLHGEEKVAHADAGYTGVEKRPEIVAQHPGVEWRVAARRSKIKALAEGWAKDLTQAFEPLKARVRARVEHPFHIVKNLFHHRKVRYRGWPRIPPNCTCSSPWPIWSSPSARCWPRPGPEKRPGHRRTARRASPCAPRGLAALAGPAPNHPQHRHRVSRARQTQRQFTTDAPALFSASINSETKFTEEPEDSSKNRFLPPHFSGSDYRTCRR